MQRWLTENSLITDAHCRRTRFHFSLLGFGSSPTLNLDAQARKATTSTSRQWFVIGDAGTISADGWLWKDARLNFLRVGRMMRCCQTVHRGIGRRAGPNPKPRKQTDQLASMAGIHVDL